MQESIINATLPKGSWLETHGHNIAVVHCEDGKLLTGVMICAYLLKSGHCIGVNEAIRLFSTIRLTNKEEFTPSHLRYLAYFETQLKSFHASSLLILSRIVIRHPPSKLKPKSISSILSSPPSFLLFLSSFPFSPRTRMLSVTNGI